MNLVALVPHIIAGGVALGAGAAALALRKGGRPHARAGTLFFGAMLAMAGTGTIMAAFKPERITAMIGLFACYLVATGWMAARRRDGKAGRFERGALAVALTCAIVQLGFGIAAQASGTGRLDSLPAAPAFVFAALAVLAAALDLNFILRGTLSGRQRIARHLWRMGTAFVIAAFSFFLGQQKVMPLGWHGSPLLFVPPLAGLVLMVFWILRVRFSGAYARFSPRAAATARHARIDGAVAGQAA